MAQDAALPTTTLQRLTKRSDVPFAVAVVGIIGILVLPVPTAILSVLLALNLSLAMIVLLVALNSNEPLEFNTFPSLLAGHHPLPPGSECGHDAANPAHGDGGAIIESFGNFVVGGNIVVGLVDFSHS